MPNHGCWAGLRPVFLGTVYSQLQSFRGEVANVLPNFHWWYWGKGVYSVTLWSLNHPFNDITLTCVVLCTLPLHDLTPHLPHTSPPHSSLTPPSHLPSILSSAEASKKILQYLAACSGHAGTVDVVKDRLLESTPVLEVRHATQCCVHSALYLCGGAGQDQSC